MLLSRLLGRPRRGRLRRHLMVYGGHCSHAMLTAVRTALLHLLQGARVIERPTFVVVDVLFGINVVIIMHTRSRILVIVFIFTTHSRMDRDRPVMICIITLRGRLVNMRVGQHVVAAVLDLLDLVARGVWHIANACSRGVERLASGSKGRKVRSAGISIHSPCSRRP